MVKSGHGSEVLSWDVLSVVSGDKAVGVSGVTDNEDLDVSGGIVVDSFTDFDEDLAVILDKISSLLSLTSGLGTNKEGVVSILETNCSAIGGDNTFKKRESTIVNFHGNSLKSIQSMRKLDKLEDDWLVLSEEFTSSDSEDNRVTDVTSGTSDGNSNGSFLLKREKV